MKFTRKCKHWAHIKSYETKHLRLNNFRELLLSTVKKIEMCTGAHVTLWLDCKKFTYSWSKGKIEGTARSTADIQSNLKLLYHDHNYACTSTNKSDDDDNDTSLPDVDLAEIFNSEGQWQKLHVR